MAMGVAGQGCWVHGCQAERWTVRVIVIMRRGEERLEEPQGEDFPVSSVRKVQNRVVRRTDIFTGPVPSCLPWAERGREGLMQRQGTGSLKSIVIWADGGEKTPEILQWPSGPTPPPHHWCKVGVLGQSLPPSSTCQFHP